MPKDDDYGYAHLDEEEEEIVPSFTLRHEKRDTKMKITRDRGREKLRGKKAVSKVTPPVMSAKTPGLGNILDEAIFEGMPSLSSPNIIFGVPPRPGRVGSVFKDADGDLVNITGYKKDLRGRRFKKGHENELLTHDINRKTDNWSYTTWIMAPGAETAKMGVTTGGGIVQCADCRTITAKGRRGMFKTKRGASDFYGKEVTSFCASCNTLAMWRKNRAGQLKPGKPKFYFLEDDQAESLLEGRRIRKTIKRAEREEWRDRRR